MLLIFVNSRSNVVEFLLDALDVKGLDLSNDGSKLIVHIRNGLLEHDVVKRITVFDHLLITVGKGIDLVWEDVRDLDTDIWKGLDDGTDPIHDRDDLVLVDGFRFFVSGVLDIRISLIKEVVDLLEEKIEG